MAAPAVLVATDLAAATMLAVFELAGWHVESGWAVPASPWDLSAMRLGRGGPLPVPTGDATDAEGAMRDVISLAVRGVALALPLPARGPEPRRAIDALRRSADVHDLRTDALPAIGRRSVVLLDAMIGGATVSEAARIAHVSVRSAHRDLAAARKTLGVDSNAAAAGVLHDHLVRLTPTS